MVEDFPWPITDDDLLLNNALTIVMTTLRVGRNNDDEPLPKEEAAELIVEAYNQGIRDPEALARFALRALIADGRIGR